MHRAGFSIAAALALLLLAGDARADPIQYLGPHPVDPGLVKGMCQVDGPHLHAYAPHKPLLYVESGGQWAFIGDPVEFEAAAPKHAYYGHHPTFWVETPDGLVPAAKTRHYCYINGAHHHWYPPPSTVPFQLKGGAYWYVGPVPAWYQARWKRRSPLDDHYHTVVLVRPEVVVDVPPPGYAGIYLRGRRGYVGGAVGIGGPGGRIEVRVPGVGVTIGGGGYRGGYRGGYGGPAHGGGGHEAAPAPGYRGRVRGQVGATGGGNGGGYKGGHGGGQNPGTTGGGYKGGHGGGGQNPGTTGGGSGGGPVRVRAPAAGGGHGGGHVGAPGGGGGPVRVRAPAAGGGGGGGGDDGAGQGGKGGKGGKGGGGQGGGDQGGGGGGKGREEEMTLLARLAVVMILASLGGCEKKEPAVPPKTEPPKEVVKAPETKPEAKPEAKPEPKAEQAAPFQKPLLDGLAKAGLKVGEFEQTAARPYKAKACVQGEVDGLEVLLCSFEGEQPAKDASRTLEQFVGTATTGAVRQRGTFAIAVADRKKTDLKGLQINKLLQAFVAGS